MRKLATRHDRAGGADVRSGPRERRLAALAILATAILLAALATLATPTPSSAQQGQPAVTSGPVASARAALDAGRYDDAIARFSALAGGRSPSVAARRGWVRALVEVGRYADAEAAARAGAAATTELQNTLGEVLVLRGKRAEAERAFRAAIDAGASDLLTARLNLALLLDARADTVAQAMFDDFIDVYNSGRRLSAADLTAVGTAVAHLGERRPQLLKDALKAYDEATAADPTDPEPRLRAGELLLEKYNGAQAGDEFRAVLESNPKNARALLGLARVLEFDGQPGAADSARRALEIDPSLVPAHVYLGRLALAGENRKAAKREADLALAVDSASVPALALLGAIHWLRGESGELEQVAGRAAALRPRDAGFWSSIADIAVQNRRYAGATDLARRALALEPSSPRALGILGLNRLRLGDIDVARDDLEVAFRGDPYNVWYKNTLDLLDTFGEYRDVQTTDFDLVLNRKEADVLAPYAEELAERAYAELSARYRWKPDRRIRVEVFPRHADFSVRSVGLVGLGALGVTFGDVIAMDSPSARERGDFNWGSTLWHEVAHVFHLGATDHRVPRWLTEGLAVREERRAHPGWGMGPDPAFLLALKQGRLLPVSRLNEGFVRPTYPQQVVHSYYEASLVAELIEQEHGFDTILGMLRNYRSGATDEQVFHEVLGTDLGAFDRHFDGWLRQRFATPLAALGDRDGLRSELQAGARLLQQGNTAAAARHLERAKAMFPEYAGPGNAYALLARIHEERGELRQAADELARLTSLSDSDYDARLKLAELRSRLGDDRGAAAALEEAMYISPFDPELHARLAGLYTKLGDAARAVRERRVIVALGPVDRAEALYQLALALYHSGDAAGARREVLRALEAAPNFQKAQELLLELHSGGGQ